MTTTEQTSTCASCASWKPSNEAQGECRRHAPQLIVFEIDETSTVESRFPVTKSSDWCGDFQSK